MQLESLLPVLGAAGLSVAGVIYTAMAQRRTAETTAGIESRHKDIDQFQEQAAHATERALRAEERADLLQKRVDELWQDLQAFRDNYRQQLAWRDMHIASLVRHINEGKGPPPPAKPEGLTDAL